MPTIKNLSYLLGISAFAASSLSIHDPSSISLPEEKPESNLEVLMQKREQNSPVGFAFIQSPQNPSLTDKFGVILRGNRRDEFLQYRSVWYEIPEVNLFVPLPVHDGVSSATTTFTPPKDLRNKLFILCGRKNLSEDPTVIYNENLNPEKKSY
jgi:hypothetical protein